VNSGGPNEACMRWSAHYTGTTWRIILNRPCAAAMRAFCQITLTTCFHFSMQPAWRATALTVNLPYSTVCVVLVLHCTRDLKSFFVRVCLFFQSGHIYTKAKSKSDNAALCQMLVLHTFCPIVDSTAFL